LIALAKKLDLLVFIFFFFSFFFFPFYYWKKTKQNKNKTKATPSNCGEALKLNLPNQGGNTLGGRVNNPGYGKNGLR